MGKELFPDETRMPIVFADLEDDGSPLGGVIAKTRNTKRAHILAALDCAEACFAADPQISEIAVCGRIYRDKENDDTSPVMAIPTVQFLAPFHTRDWSFDASIKTNDAFALAAMRFQNVVIPHGSASIIAHVMEIGETPFIDTMIHFARSGTIRYVPGGTGLAKVRYITLRGDTNFDHSGIRSIFAGRPSAHEIMDADGSIDADLQHFNRTPKSPDNP